jgi:Sulfotransferase family
VDAGSCSCPSTKFILAQPEDSAQTVFAAFPSFSVRPERNGAKSKGERDSANVPDGLGHQQLSAVAAVWELSRINQTSVSGSAMRPIFVGGCERSGTTLLGAMLGAHSSCLCVPEMSFKLDMLQLCSMSDHNKSKKAASWQKLVNRSSFRTWELGADLTAFTLEQMSGRDLVEWTVTAYGRKIGKPTPAIWIDHTPSNIKYAWTLFHVFPDAHLVHIIRDGRAVAASLLPLDWGPNGIDHAVRYWAERLAYGFAAESRWPEKVTRIHYEDLVRDPEVALKTLSAVLAISYEPAMCQGTGFQVPQYTAKQHALVGSPPNSERANAWEQQLTSRQIEIFESLAGDLLVSLGYPAKCGLHAKRMSRLEEILSWVREFYKRELVNRRRKRRRKRGTIPR